MDKEECETVEEGDLVSVQESRCRNSRSLSFAGLARRIFLDCRRSHVVTVEPVVFLFMFGNYLMLFTMERRFGQKFGRSIFTPRSPVSRFAVRTSWPRGSRGKNGATEFLSKTAFHSSRASNTSGATARRRSHGTVALSSGGMPASRPMTWEI